MTSNNSPEQKLRAENAALRARLEEAEDTLRAIRSGEVDSLVVETDAGPQVFSLDTAEAASNRLRGEILAQVSDAVIAVDREERITFFNAAAERQYRVRSDEVLGRKISEIYAHHWPSPDAEAATRSALREHGAWRGEIAQRLHDGRELHVESSWTMLRGADGADIGMVAAIHDITERKRRAAELHRVSILLDTLLHTAPIGFCFLDRDLRFARINERLAEMNGISAEAHQGRHVSEILPTLVEQIRDVTGRILATGEAVLNHEFSGETPAAPGVRRFWKESWYPVPAGGGEVMGFGVIIEEITSQKHAEETIARQVRELEALYTTSPTGLFQFDADLRFVRVNAWMAAINGRSIEAHIGRTVGDMMNPELAGQFEGFSAKSCKPASRCWNSKCMERRLRTSRSATG